MKNAARTPRRSFRCSPPLRIVASIDPEYLGPGIFLFERYSRRTLSLLAMKRDQGQGVSFSCLAALQRFESLTIRAEVINPSPKRFNGGQTPG